MTEQSVLPRHILLVEDNSDHAYLAIRGFKDAGFTDIIHHVDDGEQALDYLFNRGAYTDEHLNPRPRVILLDLRLPRVDGLDVLKTVKETPSLSRIPVIVLTSSDSDVDIKRSYDYHANSYLVKPFNYSQLVRLIKDLGSYWLGWNQTLRQNPPTGAPV